MKHASPNPRYHSRRRGTVLIIIIVLLLIAVMIAGSIVPMLVMDARQIRGDRSALQAQRLAESGLRRAAVQLAADPGYQSEIWSPELPSGRAKIEIDITSEGQDRVITSRATYPADAQLPARVTRTRELP